MHAPLARFVRELAATLLLAGVLWAGPGVGAARAVDLETARAEGIVGERTDGFLGIREASPEAVGALAAERLISRLPAGAWVRDATGAWKRKK